MIFGRPAAGHQATCILRKTGNVVCPWDAVAIAGYGYGMCALRKTGALACWRTHLPGTKIDRCPP